MPICSGIEPIAYFHWDSTNMIRFSNSQSVMLASAVRIGQSLGLHRLEKPKRFHTDQVSNSIAEVVQKELGRRLWQQLTTQDWFSVPFSDTYCKLTQFQIELFADVEQVLIRYTSLLKRLYTVMKLQWSPLERPRSLQSQLTATSCSKLHR